MTEPYSNKALTAVCEVLMDEFEQTPEQIANLVQDIARECEAMREDRNEAAWEAMQERGAPDDSAYRDNIIQAGRGHLLR